MRWPSPSFAIPRGLPPEQREAIVAQHLLWLASDLVSRRLAAEDMRGFSTAEAQARVEEIRIGAGYYRAEARLQEAGEGLASWARRVLAEVRGYDHPLRPRTEGELLDLVIAPVPVVDGNRSVRGIWPLTSVVNGSKALLVFVSGCQRGWPGRH